jgi:murein DD-endopeptidase MepM/ murein hydrolase activator NlpD
MKKLNEDINRLRTLMSLNEYSKVIDTYPNIKFLDRVVGNSTPSQDRINPALLNDVQKAAERAGVVVGITTAVSGHVSLPSRHPSGNAVDIAIIDDKAVSTSNRRSADEFVKELVNGLGYTKNREVGNPKSVLTFGFPKHDDHVHVSNTSSSSSSSSSSPSTDNIFSMFSGGNSFMDFLKKLMPFLVEQYSSFGSGQRYDGGDIIIPRNSNTTVKSPISGQVDRYNVNQYCNVQNVTIRHQVNGKTYYLSFCGLDEIKVSAGQNVRVNDTLGTMKNDVRVSLFDSSYRRLNIKDFISSNSKTTGTKSEPEKVDRNVFTPSNIPQSRDIRDKFTNMKQSQTRATRDKFTPSKTSQSRDIRDKFTDMKQTQNRATRDKFKLGEHIERIKKLL